MSQTPTYLLAKYIPDLMRGEPRNIGVIVWSPNGVEAKFLAEKEGHAGQVDGRSVPSFVTSLSAYKQWITFWRNELNKNEIEPATGGKSVSRDSDDFLLALKAGNKGNFVLEDGGFLFDNVPEDELPDLTAHLYQKLVESSGVDEPRDITLDEVCDELLVESKLLTSPHFKNEFRLTCPIGQASEEEYTFSHALKNGDLRGIYQRVPFPKVRKNVLRKNIHDAAWKFEKITQAGLIPQEKTAALVYVSDEQLNEPDVERSMDVLRSVTNVWNLSDREKILKRFEQQALALGH